jgi:hypothetical protein
MKNYKKLVAGLIFGWFVFDVAASAWHLFWNPANRVGIAVAVAAVVPMAIFFLWLAASENFRRFTLSLNPRALTALHASRVVPGLVFVILGARGVLPGVFAHSAGYGDIAIGLTAPFVALWLATPRHRLSSIAWQLLGVADLVAAVSLGVTAPLFAPEGPTMLAVTVLPLSLIPTFAVPLLLILHGIAIAEARSWPGEDQTPQAAALLRN